jgi:hypothetical protein
MPSESLLSAPLWLADRLHLDLPIHTFVLFDGGVAFVSCVFWIVLLGCLACLLPPLAADPESLVPSRRMAYAAATLILFSIGLIDEPRTFLYFAF